MPMKRGITAVRNHLFLLGLVLVLGVVSVTSSSAFGADNIRPFRDGVFLPVGTPDGIGPLALPTIHNHPRGYAYLRDTEGPDLFVQGTGAPGTGLYLFPWAGWSEDGVPIFNPPVRLTGTYTDDGTIFQTPDGVVHGLWLDGTTLIYTVFDADKRAFREVSRVAITGVPRAPSSVAARVREDGRVDLAFEVGNGVALQPADAGMWDKDYRPYDGAGIWRGGEPYSSLYAAALSGLFDGSTVSGRRISATEREVYLGMSQVTFGVIDRDGRGGIFTGSRLGNLYYYPIVEHDPLTVGEQLRLVDQRGITLRHPTVSATPIAYPNPKTKSTDLIVGGEGALYIYRFSGRYAADGSPVFEDPRPVLQREADLYGGSLVVPSVVDWDGDGILDIVAGNSEGRVLFFKNIGTNEEPAFLPGVPLKARDREIHIQAGYKGSVQGLGEARWGYASPTVIDWNGDGLPDIVMGDITGGYTVYLNIGTRTEPLLDAPVPIYHQGMPLHGHWRVQPGVAELDGQMALMIVDGEGHIRMYWQLDPYNVKDNGKVRMEDGSYISVSQLYSGHTGRAKLHLADWDRDGKVDLIIGTFRRSSVPNGETGFPLPVEDGSASMVLFLKNVGSNSEPVFQHPVPFLYRGRILHPGGGHAVAAAVTDLGGNGPNLLTGNQAGRMTLYLNRSLSLLEDPIVNIVTPAPEARVTGTLRPRIAVASPRSELRVVQIAIDGQVLYEGQQLPQDLVLDTTQMTDGNHTLRVRVTNASGRRVERSVVFRVDNWWTKTDAFLPPQPLGWFGVVDRSLTSYRSDGWFYAQDRSADFFGDRDRLAAPADSTEELIWEAPRLADFVLTLYVRDLTEVDRVELAVSADEKTWTPLSFVVSSKSNGSWHQVQLSGAVPPGQKADFFRVRIAGSAQGHEIHLGELQLRGLKDS